MSYILEALKKAEAERNRGAVPDLHAQANALTAAYDDEPAPPARPWLWAVAGAAVVLVALLAWRLGSSEPPPAAVPTTPPPPLPAITPVPAPAPVPASAPASPAEPPATQAAAPAPAPTTQAPAQPAKEAASATAKAVPRPAKPKTPPPTRTAAPKAAASAPSRVLALSELPEELRRQVPPLSIAGAVYSPQPANRMVIVNGLVAREGTPVAGDVMLEQIGPKSAVFSIRGQRFELPIQGQ